MKYPGFWFCLSLLVVLILAAEFNGNAWQSQTAQAKQKALWNAVTQDTSPGSFPSPVGLLQLFIESMDASFDTVADDLPYQGPFGLIRREKLIHGVGAIGQIKWRSVGNHPYTGIFKGSNYAFARFSWAKAPQLGSAHPYLPGVAFKFLRDGQKSANFMAMTSLLGVDTPNFFANDITNHLPDLSPQSDLIILKLKDAFAKASKWPMMVGISDLAAYDEAGKQVASPKYPYRLIFHAPASVRQILQTTADQPDFPSFFAPKLNKPIDALYSVWAEAFPNDPSPIKIAEIDLLGAVTPSRFSDATLFFQHQRMEEDFSVHSEWVDPSVELLAKQRSFPYWTYPNRQD